MIPALIKLQGQVNDLLEEVDSLKEKLELEHLRVQMMVAHVKNLIERVDDLENPDA